MKKQINPNVKAHVIRGTFYVIVLVVATLLSFFRAEAPAKLSHRTISFEERVAYQRAIEEVYWRHRIWPRDGGERPDLKPSLDEVMSQAQLEKKVIDYLRQSQALEDYWQRPITTGQLQAEMDRMAHHTKQPEVLRELFAALGDDSFVVAECLARPVLAQRLVTELNNEHRVKLATNAWLKRPLRPSAGTVETRALVTMAAQNATYTLPAISSPSSGCIDDTWTATGTTNAPSGRELHTAVWTGSEMIVWGGDNTGGVGYNTGGRYNPSTDSWTATSTTNAPNGRFVHTAVWTGSEMIVWGGLTNCNSCYVATGGRYNPGTDSWIATSTTNAPEARDNHTAVWTGSEMIVWGGYGNSGYLSTGARYNPGTNSWSMTTMTNAPDPRLWHTAVWTGSEMIVWGGSHSGVLNTGGRYNPSTDSWTPTTTTSAPVGRSQHTAVWTGSEMIVWGGSDYPTVFNTGGRYHPDTDSWTATTTTFAPVPRYLHTAVWTSSEMIIWGGVDPHVLLGTGGRYNPSTDSWRATSLIGAPDRRFYHTAVWTGSEMIVWGGNVAATPTARPQLAGHQPSITENTGGRYCAAALSPTPTPTATASATPTATATPTPTTTATATPTATPRVTPTPRVAPTPRPRPTPPPRP
jgi:N-acetylneuraminic acid mutarotase